MKRIVLIGTLMLLSVFAYANDPPPTWMLGTWCTYSQECYVFQHARMGRIQDSSESEMVEWWDSFTQWESFTSVKGERGYDHYAVLIDNEDDEAEAFIFTYLDGTEDGTIELMMVTWVTHSKGEAWTATSVHRKR